MLQQYKGEQLRLIMLNFLENSSYIPYLDMQILLFSSQNSQQKMVHSLRYQIMAFLYVDISFGILRPFRHNIQTVFNHNFQPQLTDIFWHSLGLFNMIFNSLQFEVYLSGSEVDKKKKKAQSCCSAGQHKFEHNISFNHYIVTYQLIIGILYSICWVYFYYYSF